MAQDFHPFSCPGFVSVVVVEAVPSSSPLEAAALDRLCFRSGLTWLELDEDLCTPAEQTVPCAAVSIADKNSLAVVVVATSKRSAGERG